MPSPRLTRRDFHRTGLLFSAPLMARRLLGTEGSLTPEAGLTLGAPTIIGPVELTIMGGSRHGLLANLNIGYKF